MWINNSSKYSHINSSVSDYYYEAFEVNVVVASNYSFSTGSNISTSGYIYNDSFHPFNPSLNLLSENDNDCKNGQFKLTVFLQPWRRYILIVTTFSVNRTGKFLVVIIGPTTVGFRHISK